MDEKELMFWSDVVLKTGLLMMLLSPFISLLILYVSPLSNTMANLYELTIVFALLGVIIAVGDLVVFASYVMGIMLQKRNVAREEG